MISTVGEIVGAVFNGVTGAADGRAVVCDKSSSSPLLSAKKADTPPPTRSRIITAIKINNLLLHFRWLSGLSSSGTVDSTAATPVAR